MYQSKELFNQLSGFLKSCSLWNSTTKIKLTPFDLTHDLSLELTHERYDEFCKNTTPNQRLGKLVEEFVFEVFTLSKSIEVVAQNVQINKEKISVGEIDCILKELDQLIHLEIVYKFYLYDESIDTEQLNGELNRWIGPNRNDNLVKKLTKLKD